MKFYKILLFLLLAIFVILSCTEKKKENSQLISLKGEVENYILSASNSKISAKNRIKYLDSALIKIRSSRDLVFNKHIYLKLSALYDELELPEVSKDMDLSMLNISKELGDSLGIAKAYSNLGIYYRYKNIDSAYKNFHEAEKIYQILDKSIKSGFTDFEFDYGKVLLDLAKLSRKVKDYTRSEDLTIRAIEKFETSNKPEYLPLSYTNLGSTSKYLGRYEDAVEYYLQAIEVAKNTGKEQLYNVLSNNNVGTVYKSTKNFTNAKKYYEKALNNKEFLKDNAKWKASLMDNMAYVNFLSNNLENIPEAFYKTLKIRDSINDKVGLITNNLHLAEYYKTILNDSLAQSFALTAKDLAKELENNEELLQSYQLLADVSPSEEGLQYAKKYIALNDSLIQEERAFRDKFARIRFETDQAEEKIVQMSRTNQVLLVSLVLISMLSALGYTIFKQRRKNIELEFEQQQQETNQEIYRLLLTQQTKLEEGRKLEQQRMSEELHDGVLGRLFGVRLSLDGINQRTNDEHNEIRQKYNQELKDIEKEIRLISHDLGTETLAKDIAYVDVVESLISELCEVHKIKFEFKYEEHIDWKKVPDPKKISLFRIIQESLQNIFKHANATKINVEFKFVDNEIKLTVKDNGVGFKEDKVKKGIGLKNITSRVKQMNGVVDFTSKSGVGTQVSVEIPL
ncbi:sensor histidine kinase [Aquimarina sp. ERC-38]|uniref:tetratricopeptide repeat-containing sensor histidine kinase n=1 Tax=Aquimarina sp. ERC-38 TaxID=2949996 RepID=UPI0022485056|nr:sensor histidine kinase [Aquimarina sp. ERC-38]UZO80756.1 sensor histidine kinase [Aquimarina sp. ERC-38]